MVGGGEEAPFSFCFPGGGEGATITTTNQLVVEPSLYKVWLQINFLK